MTAFDPEIRNAVPRRISPTPSSRHSNTSTRIQPSEQTSFQTNSASFWIPPSRKFCITAFKGSTDRLVAEVLALLSSQSAISPHTDFFDFSEHKFDTYRSLQNLLQVHNRDSHNRTISKFIKTSFFKNTTFANFLPLSNRLSNFKDISL